MKVASLPLTSQGRAAPQRAQLGTWPSGTVDTRFFAPHAAHVRTSLILKVCAPGPPGALYGN
ncbi:hypothetical protein GCM10010844_16550 [Deinococcus radiotolerans]|uniref:Uncharacterized protein n=1 Tax=Deinococcus radiotolerans TaxID=1309407 RepID=A0ABQ2FIT1_9DEIO|nr:hypothetical protein GCM10010844_16550 [Deinococcus radiotolerans]